MTPEVVKKTLNENTITWGYNRVFVQKVNRKAWARVMSFLSVPRFSSFCQGSAFKMMWLNKFYGTFAFFQEPLPLSF